MKNKKVLKIVCISLGLLASISLLSSLMMKIFIDFHDCKASYGYVYNDANHYYECTEKWFCTKKFCVESHKLEWVVKEETLTENGSMHQECKCGYKKGVGTIIDDFPYTLPLSKNDDILSSKTYYVSESSATSTDNTTNGPTTFSIGGFENDNNRNANFSVKYKYINTLPGTGYNILVENGFKFYDYDGNEYFIRFRFGTDTKHTPSFEVLRNDESVIYLVNESTIALCNDFVENGNLTIDFGTYKMPNGKYDFGFRFKSDNYEISYHTDNSGTLKTDTTISENLGWITESGIYNKPSSKSAITIFSHVKGSTTRISNTIDYSSSSNWFLSKAFDKVKG